VTFENRRTAPLWQGLRDFILGGTFVFVIVSVYQIGTFTQSVKDFMTSQELSHKTLEQENTILSNKVESLIQDKVARTGKPFQYVAR
jgi:hypothetical protein